MTVIRRVERLEDLPEPTPTADFVLIDVILASTSIVRLLEAGVASVRPFFGKEEALAYRESGEDVVLVGEQGGLPIDEFDLAPLPTLIAGADLTGKRVGLLTSNGTRVVERVGLDRPLFVGCPANATALAAVLEDRDRDVWLVAAGRRGTETMEDTAGADLIERTLAGDRTEADVARALETISESPTAEWIAASGLEADIESVLAVDSSDVVPTLEDGAFVPAGPNQ